MAQKVRVILLDDLINDGVTEANQTVKFSLDGKDYEIDLTQGNADTLRTGLTQFIQAARPVRTTKYGSRYTSAPASDGTTVSRGQGGVRDKARAFAIEHGLIPANQRGRLADKYRDAYNEFTLGSTSKLDTLRAERGASNNTPRPAKKSAPQAPDATDATATAEDINEAAAKEHYEPLTAAERHPDVQSDTKWSRRSGYGIERSAKIAEWTLTERIATVSKQHATILNQLAGVINLNSKGQVSFLKTSATRLHNLEFIAHAPDSQHGWVITDFGRYAARMHSVGE